jgi:hypothetical protein
MLKEPVHPAERYVNVFLLELLQAEGVCVVRRSVSLPELRGLRPPEFGRFRNRLKVMAHLNPVTYPTPKQGTINISTDRQVDGKWYEFVYAVRVLFTDVGDDPSVELRPELTSQKPGVDPALYL